MGAGLLDAVAWIQACCWFCLSGRERAAGGAGRRAAAEGRGATAQLRARRRGAGPRDSRTPVSPLRVHRACAGRPVGNNAFVTASFFKSSVGSSDLVGDQFARKQTRASEATTTRLTHQMQALPHTNLKRPVMAVSRWSLQETDGSKHTPEPHSAASAATRLGEIQTEEEKANQTEQTQEMGMLSVSLCFCFCLSLSLSRYSHITTFARMHHPESHTHTHIHTHTHTLSLSL